MTNPQSDPGQVPAADLAEVPAAAALANIAELPEGTPGLVGAAGPAPAAAGAPSLDRKGNAHDPSVHEVPARLNAEGLWAKRRGNAARRAKGLPLSGSTLAAGRTAKTVEAVVDNAPGDIPGQQSFLAQPTEAAPPAGQVIQAEVMPPPQLTAEDYTSTASGIVLGLFGVCRLLLGKAWKPDAEESRAWNEAIKRTLVHFQAPVLGPAVELIPLAITTAAKRADDEETRERAGRIFGWFRRITGRKQVADAAPSAGQVDARATPTAGQSPRVVF